MCQGPQQKRESKSLQCCAMQHNTTIGLGQFEQPKHHGHRPVQVLFCPASPCSCRAAQLPCKGKLLQQ